MVEDHKQYCSEAAFTLTRVFGMIWRMTQNCPLLASHVLFKASKFDFIGNDDG